MTISTLKNEVREQEKSLPSSPRSVILVSIVKLKDFMPSSANLMKDVCDCFIFSCSFSIGEEYPCMGFDA